MQIKGMHAAAYLLPPEVRFPITRTSSLKARQKSNDTKSGDKYPNKL